MGVNLNFGVQGFVAVQDMNGRELYRRAVESRQEADEWVKAHKASVQGDGGFKNSFVPVRVDNFADMAKDVFLPNFVNHVLKINNLAAKIFVGFFALAWDVVTLPVRLFIGLPIRLYQHYNESKTLLPVEELIKANPHYEEAKKNGIVRLVYHIEETRVTKTMGEFQPDIVDQHVRDILFEAEKNSYDNSCEVFIKALPWNDAGKGQWRDYTQLFRRAFPSGEWNEKGAGGATSGYGTRVSPNLQT
jgi:hypothetical protein